MREKQVIGVIFGGPSGEHEVSCKSAYSIAKNLNKDRYDIFSIGIDRNGKWYGPIDIEKIKDFYKREYDSKDEIHLLPKPDLGRIYNNKNEVIAQLDCIFEIVHGTYGEDGTLQGLLEICQIPYVGSGVTGSAVGMDKIICRHIFDGVSIPQVKYTSVLRYEWETSEEAVLLGIESELTYPLFIKPANMGSSVGISKALNKEDLVKAINEACRFDRRIIIEEGISMREIEIAVLGNDDIFVSLPGEILSATEFYDYNAKYNNAKSKTEVPAKLTEDEIAIIQNLAKKAFKALDLAGLSRVDFFIENTTGNIYLNEVNTLPGFTEISMYAKMWEESGVSMEMLLDELLSLAYKRNQDKKRNETIA